ncbi:ABC transporter permease [Streptomyces hygroscopicus]|uniref:ABC transporter permease n=1 Tax=Streptomyces hygroscopicus TaxID=1912 RepID=UPI003674283F
MTNSVIKRVAPRWASSTGGRWSVSSGFGAWKLIEDYGVFVPFLLAMVAGTLLVPNFTSSSNVTNVLINGSIIAVIGFGMTFVIALRGLDLSVGSAQGLCACVTAIFISTAGLSFGVLAGIIAGAFIGLVNGALIAYLRVPAFVATLGTMGIVRGTALLTTDGGTVDGVNRALGRVTSARLVGLPVPFLIAIVLLGLAYLVFHYTAFGRHVCAVGGGPEAARDSGINVQRVTLMTFTLSGFTAGMGGVLLTSQLGLVNGSLGSGVELQVIAVVVLGGTSLTGGTGNVVGTLAAALLLAMISSALNLLNIPSYYQYLAVGVLLIFALSLDSIRRFFLRHMIVGG